MPQYTTVLIIDFGSPYTQRVARRVREAGIYSVILPCTASEAGIRAAAPSAIIISGGPDSVCAPEAPALNPLLLELGVPMLGICHGMQVLAQALGGNLAGADAKNAEYAEAQVEMTAQSPLWEGLDEKDGKTFAARMAFGDRITALPPGCSAIAAAPGLPVAAIADPKRRVYGVQFHPEAPETRQGTRILRNFLFGVAGLAADWDMDAFVERAVAECREKTAGSKVVLALSGGIDSTVVAAILHRAIGDKLHCVFVDHGLMRQNEPEEVVAMLRAHLPGLNLRHVDARKLFLGRLAGVDDPEEKRKIIGHSFIELFEREARAIPDVRFLAQGTVYPDVIESYSPKGLVIKSHHNVGGLPEDMKLALVEPLRELFKDEVRAVGERLGLPEHVVWRQPFPGPGLAVRVLGEVTEARLAVLRSADHIVRQEVRTAGLERSIWQSFAVLLPLRTVGVRGEARTYEHVVALRAVNSVDAMTAEWARLPHELLESISRRILGEVAGVNRVVFDISSKPPSTIEWE